MHFEGRCFSFANDSKSVESLEMVGVGRVRAAVLENSNSEIRSALASVNGRLPTKAEMNNPPVRR